jgi:hypothetical protein
LEKKALHSKEKKVLLDTSKLLERIEQIREFELITRDRFKDRKMIELTYESLVKEPKKAFRIVGDFLGVDDINSEKIRLEKQNPEKIEELIINYDEVRQLLKKTKFAEYVNN